ncbi:MAG: tryptophan synthase subunit alpha, partial [bacterium]
MAPTLATVFANCRRQQRKALVVYVCAGDPSLACTERLLPCLAAAGADIIELGVPFSDPMADGPVIQAASQRALAGGASLAGLLAMARRL